jgi:hypothetical protein
MAGSDPKPRRFADLLSRQSPVHRRKRARNLALLAVLVGLIALFYVLTIVRMGGG